MTWWRWALTVLIIASVPIGYYTIESWRDRLRPGDSLPGGE